MAARFEDCNIPVAYELMDGYPKESITKDKQSATCLYKVAWENRSAFMQAIIGRVVDEAGGRVIYREHKYPYGIDNLWANSVQLNPFGGIGTRWGVGETIENAHQKSYHSADVLVSYETPNWSSSAEQETFSSESFEGSSEFLTLNNKKLFWGTGTNKIPLLDAEAPQMIVRMMEWVYTIYKVRTFPVSILGIAGCVNNASVTSRALGMTFPAETLLCGNPQLKIDWTSGKDLFTITLRFSYRQNGWNLFPRSDVVNNGNITWAQITDGTNQVKIYNAVSFDPIWTI